MYPSNNLLFIEFDEDRFARDTIQLVGIFYTSVRKIFVKIEMFILRFHERTISCSRSLSSYTHPCNVRDVEVS